MYTYQASFIDIKSVVLKFQIFIPAKTVILDYFCFDFWPELRAPNKILGVPGLKKVCFGDSLENGTKVNFQEDIPGKVRFQKK